MAVQSNTKKVLRGMSSQTIVTIGLGVVEIVTFSIMSRLLTAVDFGYYAAISAVMVIFSALQETGIGSALVQRKELDQKFINNAFTLCVAFGVFSFLLLFVSSGLLAKTLVDESMSIPLKVMAITLFTSTLSSAYLSMLHRQLKFFTIGMIQLISLLITSIIAITLAYLGFGYYAIITKTVLASILTMLLGAVISRTRFKLEWDIEIIKSIWGFSGWLMFSSIFRNFAHQVDRLLMSRLLSVEILGQYNRPKEFISQISSRLNGIFDSALFPVLSGIQDEYSKMRSAYLRSLVFLNLFSVVLMMSFLFNAELIVRIFFGEEWLNVVPILKVLSCSLIFLIDARLADCFLRSLGWTKQQFFFRIIEVTSQIIGLFIGARYGVLGVATSVIVVNALTIALKNYYIVKKIDIDIIDSLKSIFKSWKILIYISPIMIIADMLLPNTFWGCFILAIVYGIVLFMLFLGLPQLVGKEYREQVYPQIIFYVSKIIKRK